MLKKDKLSEKNIFIKENVILVVLVRMKSKRLPQKAKLKLNSFSIIEILIKRLIKSFPKKQIFICTSNKENDNYLKNLCNYYKINFHKGDDRDIFKRIISLRKKKKFNHFVRITGDNPFTDISAIEKLTRSHIKGNFDYTFTEDLPIGMCPEIISYNALKKANYLAVDTNSSEYMTYFFKRDIFNKKKVIFKKNIKNQNLLNISIDTYEQFKRLKKIIKFKSIFISRKKLINLCRNNKRMFNKKVKKNLLLKNSIYDVRFKNNISNQIL